MTKKSNPREDDVLRTLLKMKPEPFTPKAKKKVKGKPKPTPVSKEHRAAWDKLDKGPKG